MGTYYPRNLSGDLDDIDKRLAALELGTAAMDEIHPPAAAHMDPSEAARAKLKEQHAGRVEQCEHDTECLAAALGRTGEGRDMQFLLGVVRRLPTELEKLVKRLRMMRKNRIELAKELDIRTTELADLRAQDSDEKRLIRATLDEVVKRDTQAREDGDWLDYHRGSFVSAYDQDRVADIARRLRGEPDTK